MNPAILIVDDDPSILSIFEFFLREKSSLLMTAKSGKEAISCVEKQDFDIIFLDFKLPDHYGNTMIKPLLDQNPSAKIYLMTGYSVDEMVEDGLEKGAAGFIHKPFEIDDILQILEGVAHPA